MIRVLKLIKVAGVNISSTSGVATVYVFGSEIEFEMYFRFSV